MSFDVIAPAYRTLETVAFGDALQRCRVACLNELQSPRRALIVGEGNGRFLCELLRAHPGLEVDCVDASERMLQLARKWIERELPDRADRIHFLRRDITSWSPPENRYDLVVTHFFLDCFPEDRVADIVTRLSRTVTADATWLLADFCTPAGGFARVGAGLWLAVMYRFFQSTAGIEADELLDAAPFLEAEGFSMARQHLSRRGMLKSELWRRNW